MLKIYLSSTFTDLKRERDSAADAIRSLGYQAVRMEDYGAVDTIPVEKCRRDVQDSDLYVGIIGWRYGFIPDGASTSITHEEYLAAKAAGIPRLMFLSPEMDQWSGAKDDNTDLILSFRNEISAELILASFTDAADLKFKVSQGIHNAVANPIARQRAPSADFDLLPFQCNRDDQVKQIRRGLRRVAKSGRSRPVVCVVHGGELQACSRFVEIVEHCHLASMLGHTKDEVCPQVFDLHWPNVDQPERFAEELQATIGDALVDDDSLTIDELSRSIAGFDAPSVLCTQLPFETDVACAKTLLDEYVRFWSDWPAMESRFPTLVILYVQYRKARNRSLLSRFMGGQSAGKRASQLREHFQALEQTYSADDHFHLLPELDDVPISDAERWALSDGVKSVCGNRYLEPRIREIFENQSRLPMEPLAEQLRLLLENNLQTPQE